MRIRKVPALVRTPSQRIGLKDENVATIKDICNELTRSTRRRDLYMLGIIRDSCLVTRSIALEVIDPGRVTIWNIEIIHNDQ